MSPAHTVLVPMSECDLLDDESHPVGIEESWIIAGSYHSIDLTASVGHEAFASRCLPFPLKAPKQEALKGEGRLTSVPIVSCHA